MGIIIFHGPIHNFLFVTFISSTRNRVKSCAAMLSAIYAVCIHCLQFYEQLFGLCFVSQTGVAAVPGAFTKQLIEDMTSFNEHPIVFALSNPTSKAECTAEQAYQYSQVFTCSFHVQMWLKVFVKNDCKLKRPRKF